MLTVQSEDVLRGVHTRRGALLEIRATEKILEQLSLLEALGVVRRPAVEPPYQIFDYNNCHIVIKGNILSIMAQWVEIV